MPRKRGVTLAQEDQRTIIYHNFGFYYPEKAFTLRSCHNAILFSFQLKPLFGSNGRWRWCFVHKRDENLVVLCAYICSRYFYVRQCKLCTQFVVSLKHIRLLPRYTCTQFWNVRYVPNYIPFSLYCVNENILKMFERKMIFGSVYLYKCWQTYLFFFSIAWNIDKVDVKRTLNNYVS